MSQRVTAWAYAYGLILQLTEGAERPVSTDSIAIASALLTMGTVDISDPVIEKVVNLMLNPTKGDA
jgi:hypothetical protein